MKNKDQVDQQNYNLIIENMVDGLFTVDSNRVITYINKAAEDIFGYKRKEIIGKTCDVLESPTCMASKSQNQNCECLLFSKGRVSRKRCIVTAKNGEKKYLIKNAQLLKDKNGKVTGAVENIVDITEQVKVEQELHLLRKELKGRSSYCKIIGSHNTMQNIYDLLELAKDSTASVLISGESGTGKEVVAHAIHHSSNRRTKPFVKVNCAAFAESLLESELFGHVKGAFTDAVRDRKGRFEEAHGGTIFLDEIGDLPLSVQIKLLRVLQEKKIERVGDNRSIKTDMRIIVATNKELPKLIREGKFREDLFYRLNVIPVRVPPLREKMTDMPLLIDHFIEKFCRETGKNIIGCDREALDILMKYRWPGNVRELENTIEYAFVTCRSNTIQLHNLPEHIKSSQIYMGEIKSSKKNEKQEKENIIRALQMADGNKTKASKLLGLSRVTLWKKMKKLGFNQN